MGILYVVQPIFSRILFKNRSTVKTATYELEFVKAKTCSGQIDHFCSQIFRCLNSKKGLPP